MLAANLLATEMIYDIVCSPCFGMVMLQPTLAALAGMVARSDMVSQYDGAVVAMLFVRQVEDLVEKGKRKADEEVATAREQGTPWTGHTTKVRKSQSIWVFWACINRRYTVTGRR